MGLAVWAAEALVQAPAVPVWAPATVASHEAASVAARASSVARVSRVEWASPGEWASVAQGSVAQGSAWASSVELTSPGEWASVAPESAESARSEPARAPNGSAPAKTAGG
jgi:hypothetical protein